jgi:type IV secretory pathway VirB4 component
MIRIGQIAKEYLEAGAMSSLIGLFGFVDEHTFLTKSGDLGVVFRVPGVDAECLDHSERDQIARRFEGAVRALDERFRIYQYLLKRDHAEIPHRHYENAVVEEAISKRIEFLEAKSNELYTLDIFFVLMYEGWHRGSTAAGRVRDLVTRPQSAIRELLSATKTLTVAADDLDQARELLANKAASFAIQLNDVVGIEVLQRGAAFQFFRRLLNSYLGIIPGNRAFNLRRLWLLNTNYADLSFLFALHTGQTHNAHLDTEYLAVLETNSSTPYFLNLHYQDIAHTMILGATGSGKSFFLNFLITNLQKYQLLTYIFDLGGSYESLSKLFTGSYLRVGIENRAFTVNPFRLSPTKENLHFLFSFVKVLVESGGYSMTSKMSRRLC